MYFTYPKYDYHDLKGNEDFHHIKIKEKYSAHHIKYVARLKSWQSHVHLLLHYPAMQRLAMLRSYLFCLFVCLLGCTVRKGDMDPDGSKTMNL